MDQLLDQYRTLSMFEARAQAIVPPDALAYAIGGSASEATLERNRRALQHLAIEQRVLVGVKDIDIRARFLGLELTGEAEFAVAAGARMTEANLRFHEPSSNAPRTTMPPYRYSELLHRRCRIARQRSPAPLREHPTRACAARYWTIPGSAESAKCHRRCRWK